MSDVVPSYRVMLLPHPTVNTVSDMINPTVGKPYLSRSATSTEDFHHQATSQKLAPSKSSRSCFLAVVLLDSYIVFDSRSWIDAVAVRLQEYLTKSYLRSVHANHSEPTFAR
jgi:hypothetical protein